MTIPRWGHALDLVARGVALPNEYFYKGCIILRESYDCDEDNLKRSNIKAMLDKIKHSFETVDTIMIEPEDDEDLIFKTEHGVTARPSRSDNELTMEASVITEQLDELIHRVGSEHDKKQTENNLKSVNNTEHKHIKKLETSESAEFRLYDSETEFTIMLDKSLKKFITAETTNKKVPFNFSALDDGPAGKGSIVDVDRPKKIFNDIKQLIELRLNRSGSNVRTSFTTDFMLEATTEIVNFINKKEIEYCKLDP